MACQYWNSAYMELTFSTLVLEALMIICGMQHNIFIQHTKALRPSSTEIEGDRLQRLRPKAQR